MILHRGGEFRRPADRWQKMYEMRRNRLQLLLKLEAPQQIICSEAEMAVSCFRISWRSTWDAFKLNRFPHWLMWLTDKQYREICREDTGPVQLIEFEERMRARLKNEHRE